ncbi:amino acid adenylation domain-containing protein [Sorangium sp. So ce362]|uniref:amino acid adenylation domain-containing protein n=1 Tax=Sorangium sp. So ce362 TaxID=3133303 RepID=UPI003F5F38E0
MGEPEVEGFRLTPQQQRLLASGVGGLRATCVVALEAEPDIAALERRLQTIVERHEILRTAFRAAPGLAYPLQVVGPAAGALADGTAPALRALPGARVELEVSALQADAPSMLGLVRELFGAEGEPPLQYPDLGEWQWEMLEAESTAPARERYAARRRAQPRPSVLLGAPPEPDPGGAWATEETEVHLDPGAASQGAAVLLAAWWALLARVTGAGGVMTAVVAGGRSLPEVASALGPLAKHVPVSAQDVAALGMEALIERARAELDAAAEWHSYHDPGAPPAPTCFERWDADVAPGVRVERLAVHADRFDLKLSVLVGRTPRATLYADRRRVERAVAEHLARLYEDLLAAGLAAPRRPIGELPFRARPWAPAPPQAVAAPPDAASIDPRIWAHSVAHGDAIAVACGAERLSYGALVARAERLARRLVEIGLPPEARIGLSLSRSPAWVTAMLAVLRAGAAFVPLDPTLPAARLERMRQIAGVSLVIDEAWLDAHAGADRDVALPAPRPDRLAYVLFTSGSTGQPKAVAVEHRQVSAYVRGLEAHVGRGLRWAWVSSAAADLGYTAVFGALALGGALEIVPQEGARALADRLRASPVDAMKITPSHLAALLEDGAGVLPRSHLVLGGERLSRDLVARIRELAPGCAVWNHYGPTETTIGCTMARADASRPGAYLSLGRPLAHATVEVIDANGRSLPPLVVGELCVGGEGVARGYLGDPRGTSERFLPDPGSARPGAQRYRTGDLGWMDLDGTLELVGRADRQLKVRGFRVELEEIEAVLARAPGVGGAAVIARDVLQSAARDDVLSAFVVPSAAAVAAPTDAELRAHLALFLPEYMLPASISIVPSFPRTPSGKIDREALAGLVARAQAPRRPGPRPAAGLEAELAALWEELLSTSDVGAEDDFFELGGHSLAAMRLVGQLHRRYRVDVPLMTVFEARTVRRLARALDALRGSAG